MQKFGAGRAALDRVIDLLVEEVIVEKGGDDSFDQLKAQFNGGARSAVDFCNEKG